MVKMISGSLKKSTFIAQPLQTPFWLQGGHAQTIYAKLLQSPAPLYRRELITDSYGEDQIALDFIDAPQTDAPIVVLFHGLEGSSRSHYAVELMRSAQQNGWHGVVAHFRSCGGVASKRFYHSGDTREMAHIFNILKSRYAQIYAVGVSLGGNVLAKYLGEQGEQAIPERAVIVSAPIDMMVSSVALTQGLTKLLYSPYFLRTLLPKMQHNSRIPCQTLVDFDNLYTAPINGYANATEYYTDCQCKRFLPKITRPTLLLNAQNDPFLPAHALPTQNDVSADVVLLQPKHGGHVGFVSGTGRGHLRWLPETTFAFFQTN